MNTIKPKRGLKSFFPSDKGPIDNYQLGHDGRIEYLAAQIGTDHLVRGVNTTGVWTKWAKERGTPTDEAGLIVSKRLGGSGIDSVNLFPKSPLMDKTSWASDEEKAFKMASEMQKWKKIKFYVRFEYPDDDSLRPSDMEYQYELPNGTVLGAKVNNDFLQEESVPPPPPVQEKKAEEEEEESEYEYEYEEEEEETPEEPKPKEPESIKKPEAVENGPKSVTPKPAIIETIKPTSVQPPPTQIEEAKLPKALEPTPSLPPSIPKDVSPPVDVEASKSSESTEEKMPVLDDQRFQIQSDFIEMLPILGSAKLVSDTLKAMYNKDTEKSLWKGLQCGISIFADFYFIRAFVRHGEVLVHPITEKNLAAFASRAEPQLLVFGGLKVGNELLSTIRRTLGKQNA